MQRLQGFTEQGNTTLLLTGAAGTIARKVQGSFPGCTITVFNSGTVVLASIFSDDLASPTPKANPFTSSSDGTWFFYAADGNYDIRFSGGGIAAPFTIGDVQAFADVFLQSGTGAVRRTFNDKDRDIISPADYSIGTFGNNIAHDDRPAIQLAIDYVGTLPSGGRVRFPDGGGIAYINTVGYAPHAIQVSYDNVTLDLNGWTIQDTFADSLGTALIGNGPGIANYASLTVYPMANVILGSLTVTLTTPGNAANFSSGDAIWFRRGPGTTLGLNAELNEVVSADPATGIIILRWPLAKAFVTDGVNPFGAVNAETNTRRNFVIQNGVLACHVIGFGLAQYIGVRVENVEYLPLATIDPGPVPFSLNYIRILVIDDSPCNLPYGAGGGGVLQLASSTIDVTLSNNDWSSGNVSGNVLNISEYSAIVRVGPNNYFSGRGQFIIANAQNVDVFDNLFVIDTQSVDTALFFGVGGTNNPDIRFHNNTVISLSSLAGAAIFGGDDFALENNLIVCSVSGVYNAVTLSGSGVGNRLCDNTLHTASYGVLVSTTDHRVKVADNTIIGASFIGSYGLAFANDGVQTQGPNIHHNTIENFSIGIQITTIANEPGIIRDNNSISNCTTPYNPSNYNLFTPVITPISNITGSPTSYAAIWTRNGDTVTMIGRVDLDPTASANTKLDITLPVPSNFSTTIQAYGITTTVAGLFTTTFVYSNGANTIRFELNTADGNILTIYYSITYLVIP